MLILASKSERRIKLLKDIGLEFEAVEHNVDESFDPKQPPQTIVQKLSKRKAEGVLKEHPNATVIAADTFVVFEEKIIGKPKNEDDAFQMLKKLSGKQHEVYTGVTIINKQKSKTFYSVSSVYMKPYNDIEIYEYIKTKEPLDKAGAYAIQGIAARFIPQIRGSYSNVVGLPLHETAQLLESVKAFG